MGQNIKEPGMTGRDVKVGSSVASTNTAPSEWLKETVKSIDRAVDTIGNHYKLPYTLRELVYYGERASYDLGKIDYNEVGPGDIENKLKSIRNVLPSGLPFEFEWKDSLALLALMNKKINATQYISQQQKTRNGAEVASSCQNSAGEQVQGARPGGLRKSPEPAVEAQEDAAVCRRVSEVLRGLFNGFFFRREAPSASAAFEPQIASVDNQAGINSERVR